MTRGEIPASEGRVTDEQDRSQERPLNAALSHEEDEQRALLPFSASIPLDRTAGALLHPRADQSDIPEGLVRQLQDPSVLEDTPMYWFRTVASNGTEDHYGTIMQTDSLRNYAGDSEGGLPFCNSHRHDELPFGRTYAGRFFQGRGQHVARTEMDAYVPFDMNVNGVDTTHFIRAVRTGVARDVSIQFDPEKIVCSLDGRNMPRSLMDLLSSDPEDPNSPCRHIPGVSYSIDGKKIRALGKIHGAHCLELSPVYRGATPGAAILSPSRALVVDERAAPAPWALQTPSLRMAALLAEADLLDRATALSLEEHTRGISFPEITRRTWVLGAQRSQTTEEQESMPRTEAEAVTDTQGTATEVAATGERASVSSPPALSPEDDEVAPPVTRAAPEPEPVAVEAQAPTEPEWFSGVRAALISAGLATEGFDGDPLAQIVMAGRRLEVERSWASWGRRYREELCEDIEREGVRAFGAAAWMEARPAYEGTLRRGDADELIALRKHFEVEAGRRIQGGRVSADEETPKPTPAPKRSKIPAAAYRS